MVLVAVACILAFVVWAWACRPALEACTQALEEEEASLEVAAYMQDALVVAVLVCILALVGHIVGQME